MKSEIKHYNAHWLTLLLPYMTENAKKELSGVIAKKTGTVPEEFLDILRDDLIRTEE